LVEDWVELVRLYEGGAHLALGYASWADYYTAEFGEARSEGYKKLRCGRVVSRLSLRTETEGIKRAHALAFDACESEEEWNHLIEVVERAGGFSEVSGADVERELSALRRAEEFPVVPNELPTNRRCPKCAYAWREAS